MSSKVKKLIFIGALAALILIPFFVITREQAAKEASKLTAPPKPVTLNYTNARYSFALKFPQYWLDEEFEDPIVSLTGPKLEGCDSPATIEVYVTEGLPAEVLQGSLEDYVVKCEENLKKYAQNYKRLDLKPTKVGNLPALVLTWSRSAEITLIRKQAIFFKNGSVYVITYESLEEFSDRYVSAFDLVTSTFRFY